MGALDIVTTKEALGSSEEVTIGILKGAIDGTTTRDFENYMQDFIDRNMQYLILDFKGVKYINSTGMGILIKISDRFRQTGGDVCLVGVSAKVIGIFDMLGLLPVFPNFETMELAFSHLGKLVAPSPLMNETGEVATVPDFEQVSFDSSSDSQEQEEDLFPLEFDCPVCESPLEIKKKGKYKCPKCTCYFLAEPSGEVEALRLEESKKIELKLPCDNIYAEGLRSMTRSFGREFGYSESILEEMDQGIDEAFAMVSRMSEDSQDTCHIFMVANPSELIVGVFSGSKKFNDQSLELKMSLKIIENSMDELNILDLPSGGQLIKMRKEIQAPLAI